MYLDASENSGKIIATNILYEFFRTAGKCVCNRMSPTYIQYFSINNDLFFENIQKNIKIGIDILKLKFFKFLNNAS